MKLSSNEKIIDIMERTLNYVDPRLIGHGKRLAYLVYRMLKNHPAFDKKALRDISMLAMLHDIGAYETEEIDNMHQFEADNIWPHSIYGYLFIKYFSPLKAYAPAILYHHARFDTVYDIDPQNAFLAQVISIANTADMYYTLNRDTGAFHRLLERRRDSQFQSEAIDLFYKSGIVIETFVKEIETDTAYNQILRGIPFTKEEVEDYIRMIIYTIDFRSSQTVVHTISVACIAEQLAKLAGASDVEIEKIRTGALLHDIGKISTPIHILEGTSSKLSDEDMKIMRNHIVVSAEILDGNVDEEVKFIAINHHETLDGKGYPRGISGENIKPLDRIMCVADILSALTATRSYQSAFPKEKTISILEGMANRGKIDTEIVALTIKHYDEIVDIGNREANRVIEDYHRIKKEYDKILEHLQSYAK
ncbi:MAG: HD domain-containing protein [Defluviitaleaceae bacterium]|nr:HD domain-containing protein [Defluviitaleaceae bacterium]